MHEVTLDVQFQHITWHTVVLALLPDVLFQTIDSIMRTSSLDAGIAVLDEGSLQHLVHIVVVEMMNYPITKIRSEYLTKFRVRDDEARGRRG